MGAVLGQVLAILHQPEALQIPVMSRSGIRSTPTSRSVVDMLIRSYLHTMFHKVKHTSNATFAAENKRISATVTRLDSDSERDSAESDSSSGDESSDSDSESDGSDGNELEDEV